MQWTNKKSEYIFKICTVILLLFLSLNFPLLNKSISAHFDPISYSSKLSANIGISSNQKLLTIYGYTSPNSTVTLESFGLQDNITSDETGFFKFEENFIPRTSTPACIQSIDKFGRMTRPICIPSFPTNYSAVIGPVILPPTTSLSKSNYFTGDEVILSGQSIPDREISLSFFKEDNSGGHLSWLGPKPVLALALPKINTKTDIHGNYSFQLPSGTDTKYRFFTQVEFKDQYSPNSNLLNVIILPVWMLIIIWLTNLLKLLSPYLLNIFILLEIFTALLVILYKRKRHPENKIVLRSFYHREIVNLQHY